MHVASVTADTIIVEDDGICRFTHDDVPIARFTGVWGWWVDDEDESSDVWHTVGFANPLMADLRSVTVFADDVNDDPPALKLLRESEVVADG